jgi:hypothetical protein
MTVCASYFNDMYASSPDPWGFTSRWYEARKHAITVAMLPKARYRAVRPPGAPLRAPAVLRHRPGRGEGGRGAHSTSWQR